MRVRIKHGPPLPRTVRVRNGDGPPPLPSLPFRSQVVPANPRPSVLFLVALCSFLFVPMLTREETKNAFRTDGCKPEGRDGNGNETEGRTDGNGKPERNRREGKERDGLPPFLIPSFPAFLPFVPFPFTHTRKKTEFRYRLSLIFCRSSRFSFRSSKTGFPFHSFISHLQKQKRKKTYENYPTKRSRVTGWI